MSKDNKRNSSASSESSQGPAIDPTETVTPPGPEDSAPPSGNPGGVELVGKIVAKNLIKRSLMNYRKDDDGKVVDPAPRALYRIFGTARDVKHGDSQYGQWTAFIGSFEAVRFSDHTRFQAPQAFLQGASEGLLLDALLELKKKDPAGTLSFAFDIGVKPSEKWVATDKGNSYEYTVKTVFESQQHDPLKELRERAMKTLPQLPAPTG